MRRSAAVLVQAQPQASGVREGSSMTPTHHIFVWTEERVADLKRHWQNGLSATESARELGSVTRNAVVGKRRRLGLRDRMRSVHPPKSREGMRARRIHKAINRQGQRPVSDGPGYLPQAPSFTSRDVQSGPPRDASLRRGEYAVNLGCRWAFGSGGFLLMSSKDRNREIQYVLQIDYRSYDGQVPGRVRAL